MDSNILKQIFFDKHHHWDAFVQKHSEHIRPNVLKEVQKFRGCGDPRNGFKILVCEGCHDIKRVPYRCKGRFCTTCSCGETEEWSRVLLEDVFQVNHRHVVFTIDEGLWSVFLMHRKMLKEFMDEAVQIIKMHFEKKHKITPGIIAGLHTFGSRLNFNPHVHMLVTMGGMKSNGEWKTYDYVPFEMLRKQWQTVVLKLIRKSLNEEEKKQVQPRLQKAYSANGEGFYVHAPKQKGNVKEQLGYIGRYMKRPAIALKRIQSYDGEYVVFSYRDKTNGEEKTEKLTVEEFIARVIRHIPDENFKTIRYYGVYSRRLKKISKKLVTEWQKEARKWVVRAQRQLKRRNWRERIQRKTGKDPLVCQKCECYYEYKGEVCLEEGILTVKYAACERTRGCLERMIRDLTGKQETKKQKEKTAVVSKQLSAVEADSEVYMFDLFGKRKHTA
ncbi:IS91 family transposase [Paenibacillus alba]|uniref:Transposase n=1 Tax=Paenibacillus alba TaxID=1197127 RepID=A0ABU6GIZ7_9BACL|nr:transposase [Paenibacillus alba]MEC0232693.1 transposase [Paenibacillus alba]